MPDNVISATFAGLDALHVSFINSSGLMNGFSNLSATGSSGMRKMKAAQTLPSALPAANRKFIRGDNKTYDQFPFPGEGLPGGNVELGMNDVTLDAAAQNSLNWVLGHWTQAIYGSSSPSFANLMLLAHQDAKSQDSGNVGAGFRNILFPYVQLLPLAEDNPAYQAEGKNIYNATMVPFTVHPTGAPLSSNFGVADGIKIEWFSTYRTMFHAAIMDGSTATITLDYTPVNVASTKAYGNLSGTNSALTVSSVNTSTKVVTLSANPTAATLVVIMYEAQRLA